VELRPSRLVQSLRLLIGSEKRACIRQPTYSLSRQPAEVLRAASAHASASENFPRSSFREGYCGKPRQKFFRISRRLKRGGVIPDGREERIERETRIEQEKQENRDDRFDRDTIEEWEPERVDS
jgi:hypothetical protein